MKKSFFCVLFFLLCLVSGYSQTNGTWTYSATDCPYVTYSFSENNSWSLTWTYYYISWYRVNGVKIYNTYPGNNANISDIGFSNNYGIWHGYWNWNCERCEAHGTTPCSINPCAGTLTTVYPDRNMDWDTNIIYSILDSSSSSLIHPTYIDENTNQRIYNALPITVDKVYSSGVPWDYPNKPGGNGNGPVLINHVHPY